jgi:ribosomal protein S18 acetylase RimI-like enzyme
MNLKVTKITSQNGLAFRGYLTKSIFMNLLNPKNFGIGLLTENDEAAGALAASLYEDALWIDSVYVDEAVRRKGGGTLLMNAVQKLAYSLNAKSVCAYAPESDLKEATAFYRRFGFGEPERGNLIYSADIKTIAKLALLKKPSLNPSNIKSVEKLTQYERGTLHDLLKNNKNFAGNSLPENTYKPATIVYTESGKVTAFSVVTEFGEDSLYLNLLYTEKDFSRILPEIIRKSLEAVIDSGKNGRLIVSAATETSKKLVDKLLQGISDEVQTETIWSFVAEL